MLAVLVLWTGQRDQGRSKFHLRVGAAQVERFFHQSVAVDAGGGILLVFRNAHPALADPLFVGFREIAGVEPGQRVGVAGRFRGRRASIEPREKFFRRKWVFARVEGGAAKRLHSNEDRRVWAKNFERVPDEVLRVVIFATAQVPVVADPGQGLCLANFNGVTNERWARLGDACETQYSRHQNDGKPRGKNLLEFHGFSSLLRIVSTYRRQDGNMETAVNNSLGGGRALGPVALVGAPQVDVAEAEGVPPDVQHWLIEAEDAVAGYGCGRRSERGEAIVDARAIIITDASEQMPKSERFILACVDENDVKQILAFCWRGGFKVESRQSVAKRAGSVFKVRRARVDLGARFADGSCGDKGFEAVQFEADPAHGGAQKAGAGIVHVQGVHTAEIDGHGGRRIP